MKKDTEIAKENSPNSAKLSPKESLIKTERVERTLDLFQARVDALAQFGGVFLPTLLASNKDRFDSAKLTVDKFLIDVSESSEEAGDADAASNNDTGQRYMVPIREILSFDAAREVAKDCIVSQRYLPQLGPMLVVREFETFIGVLVWIVLMCKRDLLQDRSISIERLVAASDTEEIFSDLIKQESDKIMRGGTLDALEWIMKTLSIGSDLKKTNQWKCCVEAIQRRHIIIHNDGFPNDSYYSKCAEHEVGKEILLGKGQRDTSPAYLLSAIASFESVGTSLLLKSASKLGLLNPDKCMALYMKRLFALLKREKADHALALAQVMPNRDGTATSDIRLRCVVNHALCYLQLGNHVEMNRILDCEDWSATSIEFLFTISAMRGEIDKCIDMLPKIEVLNEGIWEQIFSWPSLTNLRSDPRIITIYELKHGKNLPISENLEDGRQSSSPEVDPISDSDL